MGASQSRAHPRVAGLRADYMMASLKSHMHNHATATYLLMTQRAATCAGSSEVR